MHQDAPRGPAAVPMVMITERVAEQQMAAALAELATLDVSQATRRLRILDPDPEMGA